MNTESNELSTPAQEWESQATKHALDELFNTTYAYRSSKEFNELIQFVGRFHYYSPYNAFLIHIQRPGAKFVATPNRWERKYGRLIKPNANPIVILQPMGPVMFVFDVIDTEPGPDSRPLPVGVEKPFGVRGGRIGGELEQTLENSKRDGIRIHFQKSGSLSAGSIQSVDGRSLPPLVYEYGKDKQGYPRTHKIPVRYDLIMNSDLSRESTYATLIHELAHLYCGHIGTPNQKWWSDRRGLSHVAVEFEAESVSYLVCARAGIYTPSEAYLAGYVSKHKKVPRISLECLMKAAGIIENMGKKRLKPRKD